MRSDGFPGTARATVIVPTRHEAGNVEELVRRLDAALGRSLAEVLFVDDSDDDTPQRIRAVAAATHTPVRLLHRPPAERTGGLSGAVVAGLRSACTEWAVVMDGDLQHPPETVPVLLEAAGAADLVVASRYCAGGDSRGLASRARLGVSRWVTRGARWLFGRALAACTDPLSGFFAIRRSAVDLDVLRPSGFKILVEILVRTPALRVAERPFVFAERSSGESKASISEGARFLRQLLRLGFDRLAVGRRRASLRLLMFGAVGASGIAVNTVALWAFADGLSLHYLLAAVLATQVSTAWNFALTDAIVFHERGTGHPLGRFASFALLNNATLLLRVPLLALLVDGLRVHYLVSNVLVLVALFFVRFGACDRFLYRERKAMTARHTRWVIRGNGPVEHVIDLTEPKPDDSGLATTSGAAGKRHYLPHRYDVHGLVRIGSEVPLRELEYFRSPALLSGYDIEVRRGRVGNGGLRKRTLVTQMASPLGVRYQEHLGRLGADVQVDMATPIAVTVGPLLARSPHVLYTNVLEALLRFLLVSKGHVLLHAACLAVDGHGVLLSARTDTGKTGTVLNLLRGTGVTFLADDMTLLASDGTARCYPKPLTISQHTVRAVEVSDFHWRERQRLRMQSRLHSRQGRAIGTTLGSMNLPIMALNAATQRLVPPPKYAVERLVPCQITTSTPAADLFIIEHGPAHVTEVSSEELLDRLVENTDDAYGFPPFRYLAPALVIDECGYEQLRAKERAILQAAMANVRARLVAAEGFAWAEMIPGLLARRGGGEPTGVVSALRDRRPADHRGA